MVILAMVVNVQVSMVPQVVVMVVFQMILIELVQIAPSLQKLENDIDMINVLNSMTNLNRV